MDFAGLAGEGRELAGKEGGGRREGYLFLVGQVHGDPFVVFREGFWLFGYCFRVDGLDRTLFNVGGLVYHFV